jgi:hypothetical protein
VRKQPSSYLVRHDSQRRRSCSAATSLTIVHALIHSPKGMPVSFDTFYNARRQQVLRRGAIKDPFFRIGEICETCACTHIEAHGRLFHIDVKIVFLHCDNFPEVRTKRRVIQALREVLQPVPGKDIRIISLQTGAGLVCDPSILWGS